MNAETPPQTSSETPSSKKSRGQIYREMNKEKVLERERRYYAEHREATNARIRARYQTDQAYREKKKALAKQYELEHAEKVRVARKAFELSHKEHLQNYKRSWYEKNREKILARTVENGRKYRAKYPDKVRETSRRSNKRHIARRRAAKHRYRSTQANAPGAHYTTSEHIRARWEMWGNRCWVCGDVATATDHVKPLNKGGSHWPANLRPICNACNARKKDSWPPFDLGTTTKPWSNRTR